MMNNQSNRFFLRKWSSTAIIAAIASYALLVIAMPGIPQVNSFPVLAASSSSAAAATGNRGSPAGASSSAASGIFLQQNPRDNNRHNNYRQTKWDPARQQRREQRQLQQLDSLLQQLDQIESEPTNSLEECSRWFNLNQQYTKHLLKRQQAPLESREGELRKREECDSLERLLGESRAKLANLQQLLRNDKDQLEYVGSLVGEYLDLKYAASLSPQLTRELEQARESDELLRVGFDRIEQFLQFISGALNLPASQQHQPTDHRQLAEAASESSLSQPQDELAELDATLRRLVDSEANLSPQELEQLSELGSMLERILADGNVALDSGKFRYLSGTLDAVRVVLLHKTAGDKWLSQPSVDENESYQNNGEDQYDDDDQDYNQDQYNQYPQQVVESPPRFEAQTQAGAQVQQAAYGQQQFPQARGGASASASAGAGAAVVVQQQPGSNQQTSAFIANRLNEVGARLNEKISQISSVTPGRFIDKPTPVIPGNFGQQPMPNTSFAAATASSSTLNRAQDNQQLQQHQSTNQISPPTPPTPPTQHRHQQQQQQQPQRLVSSASATATATSSDGSHRQPYTNWLN